MIKNRRRDGTAGFARQPHISLRTIAWLTLVVCQLTTLAAEARDKFQVLTRSYNNQRTGANLSEKTLNTSNVNSGHFGKLFMLPVDDQVFAGLLYAADLPIGGHEHNVLYVATVNNSVYAFDADKLGSPLWHKNFNGAGRPTRSSEVGQACHVYTDFIGHIGIVGTPVIGPDRTMYFVTRSIEEGATVQRLHAVDITTGNDRPNSPQVIQASVSGKGDGSNGSTVAFNPVTENQRPALALSNGVLYVGWASFCDTRPYHGWMMSYDPSTLAQLGVFNSSPDGNMAGIWMSGAGPGFDDAGNLYFTTGNGTFDGKSEFGESVVKAQAKTLHPVDFFAPSNFNTLNDFDLDFGTQGPTMLPGTHQLLVGGKEGKMYLLDTNKLGGQEPGDIQVSQVIQAVDPSIRPGLSHHMHNSIPAWQGPDGLNAYVWGESDFLRIYRFDPSTQKFVVPSAHTSDILAPPGMPGGMMTVSADGSRSGTGILWATLPRIGDANNMTVAGALYAFNAENLALLWSSAGAGDDPLNFAKGSPPIVANGKLYVASISNFVSVYGLRKKGPKKQDLALHGRATGSAPCDPSQTPDKAFNGSAEGGPQDKWCSAAANPFLQVDLGKTYNVGRFVVEHAGAGGDDFLLNTRDFDIQTSVDGQKFSTVASVTENIQSVTTYDIKPNKARYVRLNVITPGQIAGSAANIYELQVFAACGVDNLDCMVAGAPEEQIAQQPHQLPEKESTPEAMSAKSTGAPGLAYAPGPQAPMQEPSKEPTEVTGTGRVITAPPDVAAPPPDAQVTESGLAMKVLKPGAGTDHPLVNDCVTASFIAWKTDGSLFSTSTSMNDSEEICLNDSIMGIREALQQMAVGEKRRLWVPEDLTFRAPHHHAQRRPEDEEPPHKDLTFELELHSIMKAPPTPENLQPPPDAVKTPSGLAYQVLKNGAGTTHPSSTSTVLVNVSGWRSNGRLFESTVMAKHPAIVRLAMAPSGLREGVLHMTVGEKTRFWIPAALAYGEKPANRFNPAGDLIYEIELVSVQ